MAILAQALIGVLLTLPSLEAGPHRVVPSETLADVGPRDRADLNRGQGEGHWTWCLVVDSVILLGRGPTGQGL